MEANGNQNTLTTPLSASQVLDGPGSPPESLGAGSSNPPLKETPAAPAADDKVSGKLQLLMNRERAAVERERMATTKEAKALEREKLLEAREARMQEFENLKATNPMKALELLGMSYEDLTNVALADGTVPAELKVKKVEERFDNFLKSQEEEKRLASESAEKQRAAQLEQTVEKFKGDIHKYVDDNADRYEFIKFEGEQDLIYAVIDENYARTLKAAMEQAEAEGKDPSDCKGEIWTIAKAADRVEEALEKKYVKARELKKVGALMGARPKTQIVTKPQPEISHSPKTLTNNHSATPAAPRKAPRTDDDRVAAAIAYARGLRPSA